MPILIICSTFLFTYIGLFSVLLPLLLLARSIAEFIFEQFQFLFCCSSCLALYLHISFGFTLYPQCVVLKYNIFLYLQFSFSLFIDTNTSILQVLFKSYPICSSQQWDFWDLSPIYFLRKCLAEMPQLFLQPSSWMAIKAGFFFPLFLVKFMPLFYHFVLFYEILAIIFSSLFFRSLAETHICVFMFGHVFIFYVNKNHLWAGLYTER